MPRIEKLCAYLDKCECFADVGCDHGYCTRYMLKNNLCNTAVISDISAKCLEKAETLLKDYISAGRVKAVCCNGLENVCGADEVLIAGMGGEEIISILSNAGLPEKFVLQPMRNLRAVREFLLSINACISADECFESDGKFYFVIKGTKYGKTSTYSEVNLNFGLDISGESTRKYLKEELAKKEGYLLRDLDGETRFLIEKQTQYLRGVIDGEIK